MSSKETDFDPKEWFKHLLDRSEMNQTTLAEAVGISPSLVSRIFKGRRTVSQEQSLALARELGVEQEEFMNAVGIASIESNRIRTITRYAISLRKQDRGIPLDAINDILTQTYLKTIDFKALTHPRVFDEALKEVFKDFHGANAKKYDAYDADETVSKSIDSDHDTGDVYSGTNLGQPVRSPRKEFELPNDVFEKYAPKPDYTGFDHLTFPIYSGAEAGEAGHLILKMDSPVDHAEQPTPLLGTKDGFGVYVQGTSMEPKYHKGDTLIVHPGKPPRVGDFVLIEALDKDGDGYALIKRLVGDDMENYTLKQFNPEKEIKIEKSKVKHISLIIGNYEAGT